MSSSDRGVTYVDFGGDCGENNSIGSYNKAINPFGMGVGSSATVNEKSPDICVTGNDSAKVSSITLTLADEEIFDYQLMVLAQGPNAWNGGSFYLAFQDMSGDIYYLSIYSPDIKYHYLYYNSDAPAITAIYWSNHAFIVNPPDGDAARKKPSYQIVSPAYENNNQTDTSEPFASP